MLQSSIFMNVFMSLVFILLTACSSIPLNDREEAREEINKDADKSLIVFLEDKPELQNAYASSHGYFLGWVSGAKLPGIGAGIGHGLLYNNEKNTRTYIDIKKIDLGIGLGAGKTQVLVLFETDKARDSFQKGNWFSRVGTESGSTIDINSSATVFQPKDTSVYYMSESGMGLTATARVIKLSINEDLTDTGVSDVSIPNTQFDIADQQTDGAPRQWEHQLPFFAQEVIDKGYNLPLPYAVSVIYAGMDQDFKLDSLDVGVNGSDQESFDFVDFQNAHAKSESFQIKVDAWIFPFMNVFAMLGKLDGEAPVDVVLDGNGILDHLGTECSGRPRPPTCLLLEDESVGFHLDVPFTGTTYGIGTTLVGGWSNYFVSLPFNFTYADMDGKNLEGYAITITPRGGRVFNLEGMGSLALFIGWNYLQADLSVTGSVSCQNTDLGCIGNESFSLDYTIEQSNSDRWNMLVGGNWDLNKHWSWHAEYGGFIGSRDAIISSVSYRY